MTFAIVFIVVGFAMLILGANWLVDGASLLARKNNISDLVIGLTIVAFGTSAPELVVNAIASYGHQSEIVLGNVIGSNNFNLFVILGVVGLLYPISVQSTTAWREIPVSLTVVILVFLLGNETLGNDGMSISKVEGMVLLLFFGLFLYYIFKQLNVESQETKTLEDFPSNSKIWAFIVFGLAGLIFGGKLVVDNAIEVATELQVSKKVIGLTIIAVGTSLPELVTSGVAAMKKNSDMVIGNVIGSNIFNLLLVLSVSAIIHPVTFSDGFNIDLCILAGGTVFLLMAMMTGRRMRLDRWEACILLLVFIGYTVYLIKG